MVGCDERCTNCPWYEDCYEHGVDPDECEALQTEEFNNFVQNSVDLEVWSNW